MFYEREREAFFFDDWSKFFEPKIEDSPANIPPSKSSHWEEKLTSQTLMGEIKALGLTL